MNKGVSGMGAMTVDQVAEYASVSRETVYNWFHRGLSSVKVGRLRRVRPEALEAWLSAHTESNVEERPVA